MEGGPPTIASEGRGHDCVLPVNVHPCIDFDHVIYAGQHMPASLVSIGPVKAAKFAHPHWAHL